jgi:4-hydroxy-tetrahydrodipicolinate synthase
MGIGDGPWAGVWPYLVSPVIDRDGRPTVDEVNLARLIAHVREAGVHGLCPVGSSGDFAYLGQEVRTEVVVACVQESGGLPVAAGVGGFTAAEALRQAELYADSGVAGVVFMPHSAFALSPNEAQRFVREFMENTPLPATLYLNPPLCHFNIGAEQLLPLSELASFVAVKSASGDYDLFQRAHLLAANGVAIFASSAVSMSATMLLGASGVMSGPACVLAPALVRQYDLCLRGEWDAALVIERAMQPVLDCFRQRGPAVVRSLMWAVGMEPGPTLPPLDERLTPEETLELADVIREVNAMVG